MPGHLSMKTPETIPDPCRPPVPAQPSFAMKLLLLFVAWCVLLVLCWPLALLTLVLAPLVWLVALPFRLVIALIEGMLALVRALFLLPARLLGGKT